jgi:hypothetical protein
LNEAVGEEFDLVVPPAALRNGITATRIELVPLRSSHNLLQGGPHESKKGPLVVAASGRKNGKGAVGYRAFLAEV